jgi:glycosyltransferase involved in cell wall biosynthesis
MISVIIPTFNREKYITETIESVHQQDYDGEVEIIVVDDGSTDGTVSVLKKLQSTIPSLKVITTKNSGVSAARNRGVLAAKGDYIQFLDSDDLIVPNKFRLQVKLLEENEDFDLCYCKIGFFKDKPFEISKLFPGSDKKHQDILPAFLYATQWTTHAPLYRRNACDKIGEWNQSLFRLEDWEYGCRAGLLGLKPLFCNEVLSFVREHSGERLSRGALEHTASALETASMSIVTDMKKQVKIPDSWFDIMAKHLLSAGRAFASVENEDAAKRCLNESNITARSKKLKILLMVYTLVSNIFGYKRVIDFSKKVLGREMEKKSL